jgi:hypothetical protein
MVERWNAGFLNDVIHLYILDAANLNHITTIA